MSVFRRSVLIFAAVLIFFGSGGWVLTDHLCREQQSGCSVNESEAMADCCCGSEEVSQTAPNTINAVEQTDCCISQSSYFSVPVYRLDVNKLNAPDLQIMDLVSFYLPEFNPPIADYTISLHKPPPLNRGGTPLLFETGLLRI